MKKIINFFASLRFRITLTIVFSLFFIALLSNFLIYKFALESQFDLLRDKLKVIAQTAALSIDAEDLMKVPLRREGIDTPEYKKIAATLMKIKEMNKPIKFIYTMVDTDEPGIWQFVVDPMPPTREERVKGITSYPGDLYNASRFPQMMNAFKEPSADESFERDEWGVTLSGYAPIHDANGQAVAILGVDVSADDVFFLQRSLHRRGLFVLALGLVISSILGLVISSQIIKPIKNLLEGTQHLAAGYLKHKVKVNRIDEIGELADSFNQMSENLDKARKKLSHYFYDVAQALVRALEARDEYTSGHSERVAEYAAKIAVKMGFSSEKVEILKDTALLHDIGKIGIGRSLLNKEGLLSQEEWQVIRKHPLAGEDILQPISFSNEMIEIIRNHHERYDGQGYPDGLSGEDTGIFAAITAVADAYDAMISKRAYRQPLDVGGAAEELVKNSGTQFNPAVVDAFLALLKEEGVL